MTWRFSLPPGLQPDGSGVTTYYWLVWHAATDWDDLKVFLPKAAEAGIDVWVYLVPPSESPPNYGTRYSEPFRLDYVRWGEEIARLSLHHPNLTAWVIDDFYANHGFFTPDYLEKVQASSKAINPRLAFLPLMYFRQIRPQFVAAGYHYKQLLVDGAVVWEENVAGGSSGWCKVAVDVTERVRGKTGIMLAFRLLDKKGVSNFGVQWCVNELRGENLQLAADLSELPKWKTSRQGAFETGFGAGPRIGRRQFHVPFISMTAGSPHEFRMRHGDPATPERIAQQLRLSLEAWREGKCDGVVTYCLDKRPQSPAFPLAAKLFHQFGAPRFQRP